MSKFKNRFKGLGGILGGGIGAYLGYMSVPGLLLGAGVGAVTGSIGAGIGGKSGTKGMKKAWDTHIGRKGLIGEGGEMLGLWESGTTVDRKKGLLRALDKDIAGIKTNTDTRNKLGTTRFNAVNQMEQQKTGGILGSINYNNNLDGDSSRYQKSTQAIQNSINKANINYTDTISKNMERDAQASDRIFALEARKDQVRSS